MPKCRCLMCLMCPKVSRISTWIGEDDVGPGTLLEQQVSSQHENLSACHKTLNDGICTGSNLEHLTQIPEFRL